MSALFGIVSLAQTGGQLFAKRLALPLASILASHPALARDHEEGFL